MRKSFYQLLEGAASFNKITVPKLQRDYAQGRTKGKNAERIEQIRTTLVEDLRDSLVKGTPLDLNFVYGAKTIKDGKNDLFVPIDGQQRLTTLFLLHWYLFARVYKDPQASGADKRLVSLQKFSYETRDTTERFCEKIVAAGTIDRLDFVPHEKRMLSDQLKDMPWFTLVFEQDPTIASMLVVMDTIQYFFADADAAAIADLLCDADCPVTFEYLDLDIYSKANDLYIKMNSRGKKLTDFEIFKAKLQNSGWVDALLPAGEDVSTYISRYNLEFAEFFHARSVENKKMPQIQNNQKNQKNQEQNTEALDFDDALMAFVKEMVRDEYVRYVRLCGIGQKEYRSEYRAFEKMSGSALFKCVDRGGSQEGNDKYQRTFLYTFKTQDTDSTQMTARKAMIEGLGRAYKLLLLFSDNAKFAVFRSIDKSYYDDLYIFDRILYTPTMDEEVVRYALFAYLIKFGIPAQGTDEEKAYVMWKRFVYNLVNNNRFEGRREDVTEAMVFFRFLVDEKISKPSEDAVIAAFTDEENWILKTKVPAKNGGLVDKRVNLCPAGLMHQIGEERLKALLLQKSTCWNHRSWRDLIFAMEEYFSDSRQIAFLLEYAWVGQSDDERYNKCCYDLYRFEKYSKYIRILLTKEKTLKPVDPTDERAGKVLFERAMLCMDGNRLDKVGDGHLLPQPNATKSWGFLCGDCKELLSSFKNDDARMLYKQRIFTELMSKVIDAIEKDSTKTIAQVFTDIVSATYSDWEPNSEWKTVFLQNDWFNMGIAKVQTNPEFNYFLFKDCINLDFEGKHPEILLLSETNSRSFNTEIHTYWLFMQIRDWMKANNKQADLKLVPYKTATMYADDGFPYRYVQIGDVQIGFDGENFCRKKNGKVLTFSENAVVAYAQSLF